MYSTNIHVLLVYTFALWNCGVTGILYPYESETREVKSLNGLWNFKISPLKNQNSGFQELWFTKDFRDIGDTLEMPVPSSFNDITTNNTIRDYVGWVWYQRTFYVPQRWQNEKNIYIHFGSVHYNCKVWCNGIEIGEHEGGHLDFELELTKALKYNKKNILVVAVNNTLTNHTIPQGSTQHVNNTYMYPPGYTLYSHAFDYFDYAGINRNVVLYAIPKAIYITDIFVSTSFVNATGKIKYTIKLGGTNSDNGECTVLLEDHNGKSKGMSVTGKFGVLKVDNVKLWWPACLHKPITAYLYTLSVRCEDAEGNTDLYAMPVGIRTVTLDKQKLLINNEPVYLQGFGMHEDADIRGRGFDEALLMRDVYLIKWLGVGAVRTSHYPYSSEFLQQADKLGLLVILESPACSLSHFDDVILDRHKKLMKEIVGRDKNHPSIIMWSLANEPLSNLPSAGKYFRELTDEVKKLDSSRPVTFVTSQQISNEKAVENVDVVCINRYSGWYQDGGRTDLIEYQTVNEVRAWNKKYKKPVVITEYGAASVLGQHNVPSAMWSEDYHMVNLIAHFKAFDRLKQEGSLAGELIWNFIDFNTPQEYIRPGMCAKGLFSRSRQPKMAAHTVRQRYTSTAAFSISP